VRVVGVDLAADPARTACCALEVAGGRAAARLLGGPGDDDALVAFCAGADRVGIDAPFGWPVAFVEAVAAWTEGQPWPARFAERRLLRLRETDRVVHEVTGKTPLSVSTDAIGVCALRAVELVSRLQPGPRDLVRGRAVEVYPGAALRQWGLGDAAAGYKREVAARERLIAAVLAQAPWLEVGPQDLAAMVGTDHPLDALLSALVALAVERGATLPVTGDPAVVAREGWIHLPVAGPLGALA
jgi:hypothetical protein